MVAALPAAKLRSRKSQSGSMGSGERRSWMTKSTSSTAPTTSGTAMRGIAPPVGRLLDQRVHDPGEPERDQRRAREVDVPAPAPVELLGHRVEDEEEGERDRQQAAEEDEPPRGEIDEQAAGQRPDDRRDAAPCGPRPDRALVGREGLDQQRSVPGTSSAPRSSSEDSVSR